MSKIDSKFLNFWLIFVAREAKCQRRQVFDRINDTRAEDEAKESWHDLLKLAQFAEEPIPSWLTYTIVRLQPVSVLLYSNFCLCLVLDNMPPALLSTETVLPWQDLLQLVSI